MYLAQGNHFFFIFLRSLLSSLPPRRSSEPYLRPLPGYIEPKLREIFNNYKRGCQTSTIIRQKEVVIDAGGSPYVEVDILNQWHVPPPLHWSTVSLPIFLPEMFFFSFKNLFLFLISEFFLLKIFRFSIWCCESPVEFSTKKIFKVEKKWEDTSRLLMWVHHTSLSTTVLRIDYRPMRWTRDYWNVFLAVLMIFCLGWKIVKGCSSYFYAETNHDTRLGTWNEPPVRGMSHRYVEWATGTRNEPPVWRGRF